VLFGAYSSPQQFWAQGSRFDECGINALFLSSARIDSDLVERAGREGAAVYAEFATFRSDYLLGQYPDLAPIGRDGVPIPRTKRFLGACPSAPRFLRDKEVALRRLLREQPVAGVWLDYLHFHCDFELPDPPLDQSCFCDRCLARFARDTGLQPPGRTTAERATWLLSEAVDTWTKWKCDVIAAYAAQVRRTIQEERPEAKLGIFSCPWTDEEYGGALRSILGEDIDRLHAVVDVFSPMVYQVKCGRPVAWVETYTRWLVARVAALNARHQRHVEVWPIVEAEGATPDELEAVLRGAIAGGATGALFYALPHVAADPAKLAVVRRVYTGHRALNGGARSEGNAAAL
jgi:hypothetical protein